MAPIDTQHRDAESDPHSPLAEAAAEIATEQGAARGGAQVVRRRTAARPWGPSHGGKRGV